MDSTNRKTCFHLFQTEWNSVCEQYTSALYTHIELAQLIVCVFFLLFSLIHWIKIFMHIYMKDLTRTMQHGNCFLSVFSAVHYRWITRSYDFTFLIVRRNYIHCMWCVQFFFSVSIPSFLFSFRFLLPIVLNNTINWIVRREENAHKNFLFRFSYIFLIEFQIPNRIEWIVRTDW